RARRNRYGVHRAVAALGYADPPTPPRRGFDVAEIEGTAAAWSAWIERWHATSTLVPKSRNGDAQRYGQGRPLVGRRTSRHHRAGPVDPGDLRSVDRRRRPDARRRLHPTPARPAHPRRSADPEHQVPLPDRGTG